jgi:hypothetical protein
MTPPHHTHNTYTDTKTTIHKEYKHHSCPKTSSPLLLASMLLPAPTPHLFCSTRMPAPHQGRCRHSPNSHKGSRQCTSASLIRAAWACSPLPLTNGVQPPIQSRVKSLVSSILQFHTNTFIFIKAASFTLGVCRQHQCNKRWQRQQYEGKHQARQCHWA